MAHCININNKEFQKLLSETGENKFSLAAKVSLWQEKNNQLDVIPSKENLEKNYINTLEEKLIDGFLKDFNVSVTEYNNLKEDIGIDGITAADLVTKSIAYQSGESILPEVAYFAYNMLGKQNNKLRSELKYLVNKWEKYKERFNYHADIINKKEGFIKDSELWKNKIRDLVILDFLQEKLQQHYLNPQAFTKSLDTKWTKEDFSLWNKIMSWIENLLSSYSSKYKSQKEKLSNLATSIADEVLNQNYQYFDYNLSEEQIQKYYKNTIESDPFAKDLVETGQSLGLVLTGSLALRKAGSVYRTADETLHDIDWVVPYNLIINNRRNEILLKEIVKYQNPKDKESIKKSATDAIESVKQFTWYEELKRIHPSLKPLNIFYGKEHNTFESLTLQTVINGEYYQEAGTHKKTVSFYSKDKEDLSPVKNTREVIEKHAKGDYIEGTGYVVDFFIRLKPNQEQHENYFKLWKEIMIAKLEMGRDKDFIDWKAFVPYMKSKDSFNFNYEGFRHINYENFENNVFEITSPPASAKIDLKDNTYLQKEQQSTKESNQQIDSKIKNFLASIGVNIQTLSEIRDREGNLLDAVAKADMLNKIIQVVEGKADITTLSEEAAHFFVEMLGENHPLYQEMLSQITGYKIYKQTVDEYKGLKLYRNADGTVNFNKIKKEAIGKLIMAHIIKNETGEEVSAKINTAKKWWAKVWDFIKKVFKVNTSNPFQTAAENIINNDTSSLDVNKQLSDEEYLQATSSVKFGTERLLEDQDKIKLDDSIDPATGQKKHIYSKDGKPVVDKEGKPRSVSSVYVDKWYKDRFPTDNRSERQKQIDDIKAEEGTKIHKDMEDIIRRFFDEKGFKRAVPLDDKKISTNKAIYEKLENYVFELMSQYSDPATRFLSEVKIYDSEKNVAGTIDLVVINPDESVDIYDWKSQEINKTQDELKWFKTPAYRIQLEQYKRILEKEYGFNKFNKIRAIPIKTAFFYYKDPKGLTIKSIKDIEIGNADPGKIPLNKNYLLPVVMLYESTGNENLDSLIKKLNAIYDILKDKKVSQAQKEVKAEELNNLTKTIRDLQVRKNLNSFVQNGIYELEKYRKKVKSNTIAISEIMDAVEIMKVYAEAAKFLRGNLVDLKEQIKNSKSIDEKEFLSKLQDDFQNMTDNADAVLSDLIQKRKELGDNFARSLGINTLLKAEKSLDWLKRNFRSISTLDTAALNTFYLALRKAQTIRDEKVRMMYEEMEELKSNLEKWAKSKGKTGTDIFSDILEIDKNGNWNGDFINIYSKEYFVQKDKAIKASNFKWFKDNTNFDDVAYNKARAEQIEVLEERFPGDTEDIKNKRDSILLKWEEKYNNKYESAYLTKFNPFVTPKDVWHSDKYKYLNQKENEPLLKAYKYFQNMIRYSSDMGMIDKFSSKFIPSVVQGTETNLKAILDSMLVESDQGFGKIDTLTGQLKKEIPVFFTRDLGVEKDGVTDYSKKSRDLFKVFGVWGNQMYNYESMESLEDISEMLLAIEQNKKSLAENSFGKVKKTEEVDTNDINAKALENYINFYLYGQNTMNKMDKAIKFKGKEYSAMKAAQKSLRFLSLKTLGLNWLSGTATFVGGTSNAYFIASKRILFTEKDWIRGAKDYTSKDKITLASIYQLGLSLEDNKNQHLRKLSVDGVMKHVNSDALMFIQRKGDRWATAPVAAAMLHTYMVDENGNVVNIREYVKGKNNYETFYSLPKEQQKVVRNKIEKEIEELQKTKSLKATATIIDGHLNIPGITGNEKNISAFRGAVQKSLKQMIGNATREDINQVRMTLAGQVLMQFRSWMPQMMTERFGDMSYDVDTDTWNYGKTRQFAKHIFNKQALPLIKELLLGFGTNTIDKAKERYREYVIRLQEEGKIEGKEDFMTEAQFIDMYLGNLRSMMKELMFLLGFASLLFWAVGGDDDDKTGGRMFLAKALRKYYNEFAFYYTPNEFMSMIKSPVPMMGLLGDAESLITDTIGQGVGFLSDDYDRMDKNHPLKYLAKLLPITKELQSTYALFDDDFKREFAIK